MTKIEEKAVETYPEEGEYDDITELRFLRMAYLQGAKDMKDIILDKLELAFESMPEFKEVKRETVRGCIQLISTDMECRINDEL